VSVSGDAPVGRVVPDAGQRVLAIAVDALGRPRAEILGRCRMPGVLRPRWAAMVALRRAGMSYSVIGRRMRRNHTSVIHAVARGEAMAARDAEFAALVDRMVAAIVPAAAVPVDSGEG
jgi:chromosomal replication initiation ATPase DnaA